MKTIPKITLIIICAIFASNNLKGQCADSVCFRYQAVYDYINNYKNLKTIYPKLSQSELPVNIIPEVLYHTLFDMYSTEADVRTIQCISQYVFKRNEKSMFFVAFSNYINNSITTAIANFHAMNIPELKFVIPSLNDILITQWDIVPRAGKKVSCSVQILVFTFNEDNTIKTVENVSWQ